MLYDAHKETLLYMCKNSHKWTKNIHFSNFRKSDLMITFKKIKHSFDSKYTNSFRPGYELRLKLTI